MKDSPELQILVARVHLLHMAGYANTLISMVSYGLLHAQDDDEFFREAVQRTFSDLQGGSLDEVTSLTKEIKLDETLKGAKGACLIFMHAGVEACLVDLARIVIKLDEKAWYPLIENKKFSVGELHDKSLATLLASEVNGYLGEMERQSLVEKTRTLFRVLRPTPSPRKSFTFDEARVKRIEDLRNHCAHGSVDVTDFSTFYEDLEYLRQVGEYFIEIVANKFSLKNAGRIPQ
jgi:hypothetical protein